MEWQLAEAKNKFSEVFDRALKGDVQHVRRRGRKQEEVVILSAEDYARLTKKRKKKAYTLAEHLLAIPKGVGLNLTRDKDMGRDDPLFT